MAEPAPGGTTFDIECLHKDKDRRATCADAEKQQKSHFARTPSGRRIEYHVRGRCADDDPVLVLVMGMGHFKIAHLYYDKDIVLALACDGKWTKGMGEAVPFKVICMVRAGYCDSSINKSADEWTYSDFVEDIEAVVGAASGAGTPFAILANSSGGPNAFAAAAKLASQVTALCIFSGDACYEPGEFPEAKKTREPPTQDAKGRDVIRYVDGCGHFRRGGACVLCGCAGPCCCCCPYGWTVDLEVEAKAWDFTYEDIRCPVWLYAGSRESSVDPNASRYNASRIPQAELRMIDSSTHPVQLKPKQLESLLLELREAAVRPAGTRAVPSQAKM